MKNAGTIFIDCSSRGTLCLLHHVILGLNFLNQFPANQRVDFEPVQEDSAPPPDLVDMNDYAAYGRQHIPKIFRSILESDSEHNAALSLDEASKTRLENIVQVCHERVLTDYRSQLASNASNSMTSVSSNSVMTPFSSVPDEMQLVYSAASSSVWSINTDSPSDSREWSAEDTTAAEMEGLFPTLEEHFDLSPAVYQWGEPMS